MTSYPFTLTQSLDTDSYLVTFKDIPEAITGGSSRKQALSLAEDALKTALEFYFEDFRSIPKPSESGEHFVHLPMSFDLRILLLEALIKKGLNSNSLSQFMGVTLKKTSDLFNLRKDLDIDFLNKAFNSVGHTLSFSILDVSVNSK